MGIYSALCVVFVLLNTGTTQEVGTKDHGEVTSSYGQTMAANTAGGEESSGPNLLLIVGLVVTGIVLVLLVILVSTVCRDLRRRKKSRVKDTSFQQMQMKPLMQETKGNKPPVSDETNAVPLKRLPELDEEPRNHVVTIAENVQQEPILQPAVSIVTSAPPPQTPEQKHEQAEISDLGEYLTGGSEKPEDILRQLIRDGGGSIKVGIISVKQGVYNMLSFKLWEMSSIPPGLSTELLDAEYTSTSELLGLAEKRPMAIPAVGAQSRISLFIQNQLDIVVIESTVSQANSLIYDHKHYLANKCILVPNAHLDDACVRDAVVVGVESKRRRESSIEKKNTDVFVSLDFYKDRSIVPIKMVPSDHDMGTWYVCLVTSLVLMMARAKGMEDSRWKRLKRTEVMRKVLSGISRQVGGEGSGHNVLDPWPFLMDWEELKLVLDKSLQYLS